MTPSSRPLLVWRGHASRPLVLAVLVAHVVVLAWLVGDWTRLRLIAFDFREVPDESYLGRSPEDLAAWHYVEDDPGQLTRFRDIAAPIVSGAASEGERLRRLADHIYTMRRPGAPVLEGELRQGVFTVLEKIQSGEAGSCGHMSVVLAAMWRGLGGHSRSVRWATRDGDVTHYAVELYSTSRRRWMYYDMNLNGYGADEDGDPQSLSTLRADIITGQDLRFVTSATAFDWTPAAFADAIRSSPVEWYVLNNDALYMERGRRFGVLGGMYPFLSSLPYPADRILDNLVGRRDRRLVVDGRVQVAGLFTFAGARVFICWSIALIAVCAWSLRGKNKRRDTTTM